MTSRGRTERYLFCRWVDPLDVRVRQRPNKGAPILLVFCNVVSEGKAMALFNRLAWLFVCSCYALVARCLTHGNVHVAAKILLTNRVLLFMKRCVSMLSGFSHCFMKRIAMCVLYFLMLRMLVLNWSCSPSEQRCTDYTAHLLGKTWQYSFR